MVAAPTSLGRRMKFAYATSVRTHLCLRRAPNSHACARACVHACACALACMLWCAHAETVGVPSQPTDLASIEIARRKYSCARSSRSYLPGGHNSEPFGCAGRPTDASRTLPPSRRWLGARPVLCSSRHGAN